VLELYQGKAPRIMEVAAGVTLGVLGTLLGLAGVASIITLAGEHEAPSLLAVGAVTCLGVSAACVLIAWRLVSGKGSRGRQELFSPVALRFGSLVFLAIPVMWLFGRPIAWWLALESVAFAMACWALAARRQRSGETVINGESRRDV
jgi:hypothetical protein